MNTKLSFTNIAFFLFLITFSTFVSADKNSTDAALHSDTINQKPKEESKPVQPQATTPPPVHSEPQSATQGANSMHADNKKDIKDALDASKK